MSRTTPWGIADVIDFEYLLAADRGTDEQFLRARDSAIFTDQIAPRFSPAEPLDRAQMFRAWLEARRSEPQWTPLGEPVVAAWQTVLVLATAAGGAIGCSLAATLLYYKGTEPVNVAWFFAWTVGVQWLVLAAAAAVLVLRRATGLVDQLRPLRWIFSALARSFALGLRRLPGAQRDRVRAALAALHQQRTSYGFLFTWPAVIATQLFGVCFNLGVLGVLLLHVALSDLAFGWQSTLRAGPQEVYRLVSTLAAPWAFLPNAHPTYDEIVASRFAYSEGIRPLSRAAMASWWPFLAYSIICYGLAFRTVLLVWAVVRSRQTLRAIPFNHHVCNALFRRMTGPLIHAQDSTSALRIPERHPQQPSQYPAGPCIALIPEEMELDPAELESLLIARYGWRVVKSVRVRIDHPSGNEAVLDDLARTAKNLAGVVIPVSARRAPIKAIALVLQKVVAAAGSRSEILVLLAGPRTDGTFAPVSDEQFSHWQSFAAIHGLRLGVEKWN